MTEAGREKKFFGGVGVGLGGGPVGVAQTYMPHPNPVEPLGPVRGTGPSTPEGEGLNFAICNAARLFRGMTHLSPEFGFDLDLAERQFTR